MKSRLTICTGNFDLTSNGCTKPQFSAGLRNATYTYNTALANSSRPIHSLHLIHSSQPPLSSGFISSAPPMKTSSPSATTSTSSPTLPPPSLTTSAASSTSSPVPRNMKLDLLQRLLHPFVPCKLELEFFIFGQLPRLEDYLGVLERAEFWEPVFDVECLGIVVVSLLGMVKELSWVLRSFRRCLHPSWVFQKETVHTCFTGLNTRASRGSFPTPALYCQFPQLLLRS